MCLWRLRYLHPLATVGSWSGEDAQQLATHHEIADMQGNSWHRLLIATPRNQSAACFTDCQGDGNSNTEGSTYCRSVPDVNISVMKFTEYVF